MKRFFKWLGGLLLLVILAGAGLAGYGFLQWQQLEETQVVTPDPLFVVERGDTTFSLINQLSERQIPALHRRLWLRLHPELAAVRHGVYQFSPNTSLRQALNKIVAGETYRLQVTLVEGRRLQEWQQTLAQADYVENELATLSEAELAAQLGADTEQLEGRFLPESYSYTPGDSDLSILQRAYDEMVVFLATAWEERHPDLPINTPYEALILASIIEKETGVADERPLIASVFINRLRVGMRLQTDPTVIYGMGEDYQGKIRKRDLQTPTPYNTYTIDGLPPTPIAMPSKEAIIATLQPDKSDYYYFVATGEAGRHYFSKSLREHNNAVRRYILNR